jgi:adenylosuccinate lyase
MDTPLTPLDGRYYNRIKELVPFLSEDALIKYRLRVEIAWLKKIVAIARGTFDPTIATKLDAWVDSFNQENAAEIRQIESEINHDVKAVELWIAKKLREENLAELVPYVHFARTSEDINNIAYALMIRDARDQIIVPALSSITSRLKLLAEAEKDSVMLARTHGQPATPTTLGKELTVFHARLETQLDYIACALIFAKCSGATGTYAADLIAFPEVDWLTEMRQFVEGFGLEFSPITTQIESHDWLARLCNEMNLAATILIGLSRDCWQYISVGYLVQSVAANEVGSSTMPHKVNPIDFENAEANFGLANALLRHMSEKLPISRLQRDLSDSSTQRALSEVFGHYLLALKSLSKGLSKVSGNRIVMKADLEKEWAIITEAIQTIMRKNGIMDAYDQMKHIARGKEISQEDIRVFVKKLDINAEDKQRLLALEPQSYIGLAADLTILQ